MIAGKKNGSRWKEEGKENVMNWARKKGAVLINGNKKAKQKERKENSQGVKGR